MGELEFSTDLLIDESVKIEHVTLQVQNKVVGTFANYGFFHDVSFLVAEIALVVVDDFALH